MSSRAIWKGTVGFGLVNVAVSLHSAVKDNGNGVKFNQLHECVPSSGKQKQVVSTINQQVVCGNAACKHNKEPIERSTLLKGYEHTKGQFVVLTEEDIKAAAVEGSKALDITEFVPADQIDQRFFEKPYFLMPDKGGERAYVLLREAIRKKGMVGLGVFAPRANSLHVSAITVHGDALVLSTLRWHEDVVPEVDFQFPTLEINQKELKLAESLVDNLASDEFDPTKFENVYRENLMGIIMKKLKGEKVEVAAPAEEKATPAVDLMGMLEASVAAGGAARKGLAKKTAKKSKVAA